MLIDGVRLDEFHAAQGHLGNFRSMPKHYSSLPQHNGNLICAVDLETTGSDPDKHEIIQLAFVPLDTDYTMLETIEPFYMNVKPLHPETADPAATRVHGLNLDHLVLNGVDPDEVNERFEDWFADLELAFDRRLIMLAHNCQFEIKFLSKLFGPHFMERVFNFQTRDSMAAAIYINDHAVMQGKVPPFDRVNLTHLCTVLGIKNPKEHDAFADATAGALVYRELLKMDVLL